MAALVDHEIGVIEDEEAGAVEGGVEEEECEEDEFDNGDGAGDGFPVVDGEGRKGHGERVAVGRTKAMDSLMAVFKSANTEAEKKDCHTVTEDTEAGTRLRGRGKTGKEGRKDVVFC